MRFKLYQLAKIVGDHKIFSSSVERNADKRSSQEGDRSRIYRAEHYGWRFLTLSERSRPMSVEFLNAVMGCMFVGVWLIVGHIMAVDYF